MKSGLRYFPRIVTLSIPENKCMQYTHLQSSTDMNKMETML